MAEIVGALPGISGLIEKGGVIGILLLMIGVLVYEVRRLRTENKAAYYARDRYRIGFAVCKNECDRAGIKVDLSMLTDLLDERGSPA